MNEDRGAVIAAEQRNLGDDVVQQLKDTDDGLGWHFVSADEARKGLEDGEYFMTCTIPADFSESIASVDGSAPEKAQLKIDYNQSENMLASQIGETVWKEVRTRCERHGGRRVLDDPCSGAWPIRARTSRRPPTVRTI